MLNHNTHIWLRAETKPQEQRTALTPKNAKTLLEKGFKVSVESSIQNIFDDHEYLEVGCEVVPAGSWESAPKNAYILGLKELPESEKPLIHKHIYFAHAYKQQSGWQGILNRFVSGNGELFDLEYLVDENNRRIAAFGYWAGFAGAALAVQAWCDKQLQIAEKPITAFPNKEALISSLKSKLSDIPTKPNVMVIGAKGRSGSGACQLAKELFLEVTPWDMQETAKGGPFKEINEHDIFVNCVLVNKDLPPFLNFESLADDNRQLSIIADVSCDPYGSYNPLPIYGSCTTFNKPSLTVDVTGTPISLIAIDHLPSLLPRESSEDYGEQLLPHIESLATQRTIVWDNAIKHFKHHSALV